MTIGRREFLKMVTVGMAGLLGTKIIPPDIEEVEISENVPPKIAIPGNELPTATDGRWHIYIIKDDTVVELKTEYAELTSMVDEIEVTRDSDLYRKYVPGRRHWSFTATGDDAVTFRTLSTTIERDFPG